jgi:hypothetical protein
MEIFPKTVRNIDGSPNPADYSLAGRFKTRMYPYRYVGSRYSLTYVGQSTFSQAAIAIAMAFVV